MGLVKINKGKKGMEMKVVSMLLMLVVAVLTGCERQKIGMLGFRVDDEIEVSQENKEEIGVRFETKREDGLVEWKFHSQKPIRDFKEGVLVIDTNTEKIIQIRAERKFTKDLDALHEYDRVFEVFKEKYPGEWETHEDGLSIRSSCKLPDGLSVDVDVVNYDEYTVVLLMMTNDYFDKRREREIKKDMDTLD